MKILYFDCFAGAAGDMILGALLDAGLPFEALREALGSLAVEGYDLAAARVLEGDLTATKFRVLEHEGVPADRTRGPSGHAHYHLRDIRARHVVLHAETTDVAKKLEDCSPLRYRDWLFAAVGAETLGEGFAESVQSRLPTYAFATRHRPGAYEALMMLAMDALEKKNARDTRDLTTRAIVTLQGNNEFATVKGSKVSLYYAKGLLSKEVQTTRGFMSSSSHRVHFGLGANNAIDSMVIRWPDGMTQTINKPEINKKLVVNRPALNELKLYTFVQNQPTKSFEVLPIRHEENQYNDENNEKLIPERLSNLGPALITADLNNDKISGYVCWWCKKSTGENIFGQIRWIFHIEKNA